MRICLSCWVMQAQMYGKYWVIGRQREWQDRGFLLLAVSQSVLRYSLYFRDVVASHFLFLLFHIETMYFSQSTDCNTCKPDQVCVTCISYWQVVGIMLQPCTGMLLCCPYCCCTVCVQNCDMTLQLTVSVHFWHGACQALHCAFMYRALCMCALDCAQTHCTASYAL